MSGARAENTVPKLGYRNEKKQEQMKDNSFDTSRNGGDEMNTTSQAIRAIKNECRL